MASSIDRRIRRLEEKLRNRAESGPSIAEIIRERRRKRLLAEGKDPEPERPRLPSFDERGRPLKIGEIIRQARFARLARERAENPPDQVDRRPPGSASPDPIK
jgi:hypothetical protein